MLAVQQAPKMASDRSPPSDDPYLPFGYSINPNQDASQEPLTDPPDPPPGEPLLTDADAKFLGSFFDDIGADQYNMPSFGEGLNFSDAWLNIPPQLMGTATSFGQQTVQPMASVSAQGMSNDGMGFSGSLGGSHMMPPPPLPQHQHQHQQHVHQQQQPRHPDDVLNAAATLLHNNQPSPSSNPSQSTTSDPSLPRRTAGPAMGPPVGHLRHQPLEEFQEEGRRATSQNPPESTFADWMLAPPETRVPRSSLPDFQWGSDSNFSTAQGYTPDNAKETVESMHREQLRMLDALEVSRSNPNTRPSSPSSGQNPQSASRQGYPQAVSKGPEDPDAPPRKRRKSKGNREAAGQEDDDETGAAVKPRRRKPKAERPSADSPPPPPSEASGGGKKRRGTINGAKQMRENLSEEQKRENHIRSEQKRRTLIKEGYDDLCELVPGLRGGGFSKSAMLSIAGDWLDELIEGNKVLEKQLADLEQSR